MQICRECTAVLSGDESRVRMFLCGSCRARIERESFGVRTVADSGGDNEIASEEGKEKAKEAKRESAASGAG
jgi:hypothetical protein